MNPNRYKFIVNVVIGEQRGAGVKVGTRCIWDTESDSYAFDNFMNVSNQHYLFNCQKQNDHISQISEIYTILQLCESNFNFELINSRISVCY